MATTSRKLPGIGLTGGWSTGENGWGAGANQNWLVLSVVSQAVALDLVTTLPTSPNQGDVYLLTSGATVDATYIAAYDNSAWVYISPGTGWLFYVTSKAAYYKFDSSNWVEYESGSGSSTGSIPVASASTVGGVKVGNGLAITADGTLSATGSSGGSSDYVLPAATTNALGGVIVGQGLSVDASGTVSWAASMTGYLAPYVFSVPTDTDRTLSSTAYNVKGTVITVGTENYTVRGAGAIIDTIAGHTYKMAIATLNSDHSIDTVVASSTVSVTANATEQSVMFVLSGPVTLSAGVSYAFLFCDTSQSNGAAELAMYGSGVTNSTMTYFGLAISSPWRAVATDIVAGLAMDASNPWGNGGYYIGVMGAASSIIQSSIVSDDSESLDSRFVKQGDGFSNFNTNNIYMGWRKDGTGLGVGVDSTDLGNVAFQSWVGNNYASTAYVNQVATSLTQSLSGKFNTTGGTINGETTIAYGGMSAAFQDDGNLVVWSGSTKVFVCGTSALQWNGHNFVFTDDMPVATTDLVQHFTVSSVSSGSTIAFPVSFSAPPVVLVQAQGTTDDNCHAATVSDGSFVLHVNLGGSPDISVIAIGAR